MKHDSSGIKYPPPSRSVIARCSQNSMKMGFHETSWGLFFKTANQTIESSVTWSLETLSSKPTNPNTCQSLRQKVAATPDPRSSGSNCRPHNCQEAPLSNHGEYVLPVVLFSVWWRQTVVMTCVNAGVRQITNVGGTPLV